MLLPLQQQEVRPPQRMDGSGVGSATSLSSDAENGLAAVAWVDASLGAPRVLISVSRDTGGSWTAPAPVDADLSGASKRLLEASVDVVAGEIRMLWLDDRHGAGNNDLYFRVSRDGGQTWEPEIRLDSGSAPGGADVTLFRARAHPNLQFIAVAAIVSALPGGDEVRTLISTDGGVSFHNSISQFAGGVVARLDLDDHGTALHLTWMDDSVTPGFNSASYRGSTDYGQTWQAVVPAISGTVNTHPSELRIAADAARVIVVFQDLYAIHAVGCNVSLDNGATWLPAARRIGGSRSPTVTPAEPRVFLTPFDILVCWSDDRTTPGYLTPWIAGTSNGGSTWSELPLDSGYGFAPRIHGDEADGTFAVQWQAPAKVKAAGSRAVRPEPLPAFTVASGAASDSVIAATEHSYDSAYAHHFSCWLDDSSAGGSQVWTSGFRLPSVVMQGNGQAGSPVRFGAWQFRAADAGRNFQVLLSGARGSAPLPFGDGRSTGLAAGAWLSLSARAPALRGRLGPSGAGSTSSVLIPAGLPAGTRIVYCAVAFDAPARAFGDLADARDFLVQ